MINTQSKGCELEARYLQLALRPIASMRIAHILHEYVTTEAALPLRNKEYTGRLQHTAATLYSHATKL